MKTKSLKSFKYIKNDLYDREIIDIDKIKEFVNTYRCRFTTKKKYIRELLKDANLMKLDTTILTEYYNNIQKEYDIYHNNIQMI